MTPPIALGPLHTYDFQRIGGDEFLLRRVPTSRTHKRGALHVAAAPDGGAASPAAPVRGIPHTSRPMRLGEERSP